MAEPKTDATHPDRATRLWPSPQPLSVADASFHGSLGFHFRVGALATVALVVFAVLGIRLWSLQLIQGPEYSQLAKKQSIRVLRIPPARGAIVDRAGRVLVDDQARLTVVGDAQFLGETDARGRWRPTPRGRFVLGRLSRLTGVPVSTLVRRMRQSRARNPWSAGVLVPRASRELAFHLDEWRARFPGLAVEAVPERRYPNGALGSSFLGLLGEIGRSELGTPAYAGHEPGDVVGKSGVEATYERMLGARAARQAVPVDALGQPVGPPRLLRGPSPARVLELTVDLRLQRAVERALAHGIELGRLAGHPDANAGAAVVLDARNGGVLALASAPSFDQARAARDDGYLAALLDPSNAARPLVNRVTQGLYPVGSTFKPIVAEAALASGLITPWSTLPCTGSFLGFRNVDPTANSSLTLPQALEISCDTWFYRLGYAFYLRQAKTGALEMQRWAHALGLGRRTGIDLPGEAAGVVPTPRWLRASFEARWARTWYPGTSINLSIGQGYLAVTPLQLAVAYAALANGGKVVRPHLARAVREQGRIRPLGFPPARRVRLTGLGAIHRGVYAAANGPAGTSTAIFSGFPVKVAGKTGTAEAPFGSDHSWYASWAPAGRPQYVVVVLVEHGGFGAEAAAPAAREIYDAIFRAERR